MERLGVTWFFPRWRKEVCIAGKQPAPALATENGKRMTPPRSRCSAGRGSGDHRELAPHECPIARHLNFLDIARTIEFGRGSRRLCSGCGSELSLSHGRLPRDQEHG